MLVPISELIPFCSVPIPAGRGKGEKLDASKSD